MYFQFSFTFSINNPETNIQSQTTDRKKLIYGDRLIYNFLKTCDKTQLTKQHTNLVKIIVMNILVFLQRYKKTKLR